MPVRVFSLAVVAILALQLIPGPEFLWQLSPGRRHLAEQANSISLEASHGLWALLPFEALKSAVWLLPFLSVLFVLSHSNKWRTSQIFWPTIGGMVLSVFIGSLQLAGGVESPFYLYDVTNRGSTVGFFANSNHLATLLLISIPMIAALSKQALGRNGKTLHGPMMLAAPALLLITLAGVAINGSLAAYGLILPVLVSSTVIFISSRRSRALILTGVTIGLVSGFIWLFGTAAGQSLLEANEFSMGDLGRGATWMAMIPAIWDFFPFGSGLGSFAEVFRLYENESTVVNKYMSHAHNDYLELALELGILGILGIGVFLAWWSSLAIKCLLAEKPDPNRMAATLATAIILVHSIVDYPLRTAAVSAIFAACLCILALQRQKASPPRGGS